MRITAAAPPPVEGLRTRVRIVPQKVGLWVNERPRRIGLQTTERDMGLFDKDPEKKDNAGNKPKADFSNVRGGSSEDNAGNKPKADFSNVRGGSSSTAPSSRADVEVRSYTVVSGDSLSKIAKREYGDAQKWRQIYEANRDQIKDPDLIHPGQVLTIPAKQ
jgi:nucleoid-associated protein YgaU